MLILENYIKFKSKLKKLFNLNSSNMDKYLKSDITPENPSNSSKITFFNFDFREAFNSNKKILFKTISTGNSIVSKLFPYLICLDPSYE